MRLTHRAVNRADAGPAHLESSARENARACSVQRPIGGDRECQSSQRPSHVGARRVTFAPVDPGAGLAGSPPGGGARSTLAVMRVPAAIVAATVLSAGCAAGAPSPWQRGADAPEGRTEVAAAAVGGRVVVAGGFTADGRASRHADLYDVATDRWSRLPDLPIALHHAMAAADGRRVYVAGGYTTVNALTGASARVFALRPGDGRWSELPRMPGSRAAGGAAAVAGRLYVVGGTFGARPRLARRSFVLDLRTRRWSVFPGLPQPREHLGAAAAGDRVYVLGGRTAAERFRRADAWDVSARRWVRLADMPTARGGTSATARAGRLVSIGGESSRGTNREVEELDTATGRWRRLPPLPQGRHGLGVAAVDGRVFALMGGPEPGLSVSASVFALR